MNQTTETPSAPSKLGDWRPLLDRFNDAAREYGYGSDNDEGRVKAEYAAAHIAMLECLASLEKERDEARRERDNPDYTTEDYHRLHRAHCATEDARRKAVEERDAAYESGALDMRERAARKIKSLGESQFEKCERLGFMDPETGARECSLEVNGRACLCQDRDEFAEELCTAISTLDPKGDRL